MTREPDPTAFDEIVASWRAEGGVPEWPDDPRLDGALEDALGDARTAEPPADRRGDDRRAEPFGSAERPDTGPRADRPHTGPRTDRPDTGPRADRPDTGPRTDRPDTGPRTDRPELGPRADRPDIAPRSDRPTPGPDAELPPFGPGAKRSGADPHSADDASAADRRDLAEGEHVGPSERSARSGGSAPDPLAEEHFVPPEPPPLPRMGPPILVGLTLIGLGLVLVSFPGWVGVPQVYGLPLGLVAIAAGLGWLVLRLWPDPDDVPPPLYLDDPDDPDGGAVL